MWRGLAITLASGVLVTSWALPAVAGNPNKPHRHKGVLKPYAELPPLQLSDADRKQLAAGKAVFRQTEGDSGGRGLAIFKVNAPRRMTWDVINDFASYPKWINHLRKTEVYKRDGGNIDVAFVLAGYGFSIDYYIHHTYHPEQTWGTWTLDYSRSSDLDDSVGFWRVTDWADDPSQCLVEYSVDVQVRGWIPGFIRSAFVDRGLKEATQWVKVQAENRRKSAPPAPVAPPPAAPSPATPAAVVDAGAAPVTSVDGGP